MYQIFFCKASCDLFRLGTLLFYAGTEYLSGTYGRQVKRSGWASELSFSNCSYSEGKPSVENENGRSTGLIMLEHGCN